MTEKWNGMCPSGTHFVRDSQATGADKGACSRLALYDHQRRLLDTDYILKYAYAGGVVTRKPIDDNARTDRTGTAAPSVCRGCGGRNGAHTPGCRTVERAIREQRQATCDHRPEYGTTRTTGDPPGPPCCGRCGALRGP